MSVPGLAGVDGTCPAGDDDGGFPDTIPPLPADVVGICVDCATCDTSGGGAALSDGPALSEGYSIPGVCVAPPGGGESEG